MKKLNFSEIILLSLVERKARKVTFDPKRTIILGENNTGKSCLIKSILETFGAEPSVVHPTWKQADVISLIHFSVKDAKYSILKYKNSFSIFDQSKDLLKTFNSVTNELGPFLAEIFDFKIRLSDRKGKLITPPPAYLFLPYYIDQDSSWKQNWSSFSNLNQFNNWKPAIAEYHSGLKSNEYYETRGEMDQIRGEINTLENEKVAMMNILNNLKKRLSKQNLDIDLDSFKYEIEQLLVECEQLSVKQDRIKSELSTLHNLKIKKDSEILIIKKALEETKKDYVYAVDMEDDSIECPTCGAHYDNSFRERFSIAQDEQRCQEFLIEISAEISEIDKKIREVNDNYLKLNEETLRIEALLHSKRGDFKLKDLIESEGKKELRSTLTSEVKRINEDIIKKNDSIDLLNIRLKNLIDAEKKQYIEQFYFNTMRSFLHKLDVEKLNEKSYPKMWSRITETGSSLPRALICYYFTFINLMSKYSSSVFCPIIIDAPNQQGQDLVNLRKILDFINNNQPENSQMILALENKLDVDFKAKEIILDDKYSLLQKDDYDDLYQEIKPFLDQSLNLLI